MKLKHEEIIKNDRLRTLRSILLQSFTHYLLNSENKSSENHIQSTNLSSNTKNYILNSFWKCVITLTFVNFQKIY